MESTAVAGGGGGEGPRCEKTRFGAVIRETDAEEQEPEEVAAASREEERPLRRGLAAARARRRAGPATPSPSWKLEASSPPPDEEDAEEAAPPAAATAPRRSSSAASARQLGATLWEIQDVIRVAGAGRRIRRRRGRGPAGAGGDEVDRPQSSGGCDRNLAASLMEHHKLHEERSHKIHPFSPASYTSSIGAATVNIISPTRSLDIKARPREAGYSLKTSTELLKVLNRIWSLEEQQTINVSAMKGLKLELQQAQDHIQELTQERQRYRHEVDYLMRQASEDKMLRKNKEQEKVRAALHSLQQELEDERHLRRHSEGLHRKLGKELSEIKSAFINAVKDLEKEKKANSLLENLCDEFAKGIRNYEEEVRLLRQRHVKDYAHKFDKSVLHISEAWLDGRMQMQNADARGDFADKTSITERLCSEIQGFLLARRSSSSKNDNIYANNGKRDASLCRQSLESVHLNGVASAPLLAEDDDDDSVASDLHCFELNMHGGGTQNHNHTGPCRRVTGSMHSPMRRLEYSHSISAEGSQVSHIPTCSQKDKVRSSSSKVQLIARTPEIDSHKDAGITPADKQDELVMAQVAQGLLDNLSKINLEVTQVVYPGQESHDHYSRAIQFCEGTTSGDLCNLQSPVRKLNYQCTLLDREVSESSLTRQLDVKGNTLKAKLLQARLEGRHARLRASGHSLTSTRR